MQKNPPLSSFDYVLQMSESLKKPSLILNFSSLKVDIDALNRQEAPFLSCAKNI